MVLTTLVIPKTAVRSLGRTIEAKNAERGAVSIDCVQDRRTRNIIASGREFVAGINARKIEDGKCVKTIVWMLPILFAREEATSIEPAAMKLVTKNIVPTLPSARSNLMWKKYDTQELCTVSCPSLSKEPTRKLTEARGQKRGHRLQKVNIDWTRSSCYQTQYPVTLLGSTIFSVLSLEEYRPITGYPQRLPRDLIFSLLQQPC